MRVKAPTLTRVVLVGFALTLLVTGTLTAFAFDPSVAPEGSHVRRFMDALVETARYIPVWIGLFKMAAAVGLLVPVSRRVAVLALFGYTVNILLYTVFIVPVLVPLGLAFVACNTYLCWAHADWYLAMLRPGESGAGSAG